VEDKYDAPSIKGFSGLERCLVDFDDSDLFEKR
jgi:hypothetical protein